MSESVISVLEEKNGSFVPEKMLIGFSEAGIERELNRSGFEWEHNGEKGYRIVKSLPVYCEGLLKKYLDSPGKYKVYLMQSVDSTNNFMKTEFKAGAPEFSVALAEQQTAGRGRMNRKFISPLGGIYMSVLFTPERSKKIIKPAELVNITAAAAVSVAKTIEAMTGLKAGIKWVNDIFLNGKKVCGILTEGSISPDQGGYDYIIVGIGVDLISGFDGTGLENIAGGIFEKNHLPKDICRVKNKLTAGILNNLVFYYEHFGEETEKILKEEYISRLFIMGQKVTVVRTDLTYEAEVIGLEDDFSLSILNENGNRETLHSGEVRLKI